MISRDFFIFLIFYLFIYLFICLFIYLFIYFFLFFLFFYFFIFLACLENLVLPQRMQKHQNLIKHTHCLFP